MRSKLLRLAKRWGCRWLVVFVCTFEQGNRVAKIEAVSKGHSGRSKQNQHNRAGSSSSQIGKGRQSDWSLLRRRCWRDGRATGRCCQDDVTSAGRPGRGGHGDVAMRPGRRGQGDAARAALPGRSGQGGAVRALRPGRCSQAMRPRRGGHGRAHRDSQIEPARATQGARGSQIEPARAAKLRATTPDRASQGG